MIPERLPWHEPQWLRIERGVRSGRMPHALLLRGASGHGKAMFAGPSRRGAAVRVGRRAVRRVRVVPSLRGRQPSGLDRCEARAGPPRDRRRPDSRSHPFDRSHRPVSAATRW